MDGTSCEPELFIVADHGAVHVYESQVTPRGTALRPREDLRIAEGHGRFREKYTDQAGAFPNRGTDGHGNSIAERPGLVAEEELRGIRHLATAIHHAVSTSQARHWCFAAPPDVSGAVLDHLPPETRDRLRRTVTKDLTKVTAAELLERFRSW